MLTRRRLLVTTGAASAIVAAGIPVNLSRAISATRIRYEVNTAEGQAALLQYREAVKLMKDENLFPRHDPRSWKFQANIHWIHPEDNEPGEIDKIFSTAGLTAEKAKTVNEHRELALVSNNQTQAWSSCQHVDREEHFFLAWHRLYIWHFEQIVESILGKPFALPYWDYTKQNTLSRTLPLAFREKILGSFEQNSLWYSRRDAATNHPTSPVVLDDEDVDISNAFNADGLYKPSSMSGFNRLLNNSPHGSIHVRLGAQGGDVGMADVPTAARDPIFWIHHCTIDRLWEMWRRKEKGKADEAKFSASWTTMNFVFADVDGRPSVVSAAKALDLPALGYDYIDIPSEADTALMTMAVSTASIVVLAATDPSQETIVVGKGGIVDLSVTPSLPLSTFTFTGNSPSQLELEIQTSANPGDIFNVSLVVPETPGGPDKIIPIGRINFFGISTQKTSEPFSFTLNASNVLSIALTQSGPIRILVSPLRGPTSVPISVRSVRLLAKSVTGGAQQ